MSFIQNLLVMKELFPEYLIQLHEELFGLISGTL